MDVISIQPSDDSLPIPARFQAAYLLPWPSLPLLLPTCGLSILPSFFLHLHCSHFILLLLHFLRSLLHHSCLATQFWPCPRLSY